MNAFSPSLSAKLSLMVLTVCLITVGHGGQSAAADPPVLTLPPVTLSAFAEVPPLKTLEVDPIPERLRHHGGQGRKRKGSHETARRPTHPRTEKVSQ